MKLFILSVSSLALLAGCKAAHNPAKDPNAQTVEKTTCELKGEKRVLETYHNSTACEVLYRKGGSTKSIADSVNGPAYCADVVQRMTTKLKAAGWKCK